MNKYEFLSPLDVGIFFVKNIFYEIFLKKLSLPI